ncbi:MAG TPA: hypothetical protein VEK55_00930 [Xanthobacteraceae bacterium]|nr:hypothetical protein [Xanthobacteraceae bacterium]
MAEQRARVRPARKDVVAQAGGRAHRPEQMNADDRTIRKRPDQLAQFAGARRLAVFAISNRLVHGVRFTD